MTVLVTDPKTAHVDYAIDEPALKAVVGGILNRRPAVGLAVGVVRNGRLEFFHGRAAATSRRTRPSLRTPSSATVPSPRP
jgi:hypothetical protein